jgi:hypothetical protein
MKKVCQISIGGDALSLQYETLLYLKKILIVPSKATNFEKLTFTNKFYPFSPIVFYRGRLETTA